MNTIKNVAFLAALLAGISFVSCSKDTATVDEEQTEAVGISQDIINKVNSLHFNTYDLQETSFEKPNGKVENAFLIEGDITMSHDQIMNMELGGDITSKQYRTNNLVNDGTINIIGFTGNGSNGLTSKMQTALRWAVANYNRLNLDINFNLTFGTNYQSKDIVVYRIANGEAGGRAGFPSNGNPYKWVRIYSGMEAYNTNVNEHVITHEIGHAVGFRHTDWFSRQSCGQTGESAGATGAVHIPGTPTGYDPTSIMLACFRSDQDGEFNDNDVTALRFLY